jgi:hypothetical protein
MIRSTTVAVAASLCCHCFTATDAATVAFFDSSQVATLVGSEVTSDTIRSNGHVFTYTRDKLFTGGGSEPIGRSVRVAWPEGVEAQAVKTPPPGVTDHKARIVLERADGDVFDLTAFTAKLLANTAGAGAQFEVMPRLDGEDAFDDPIYFNATGFYGSTFSYDTTTPIYLGNTSLLKDFEAYTITLYVDFAWTALTLEGALVPAPLGDYSQNYAVDVADYVLWRDNLGSDTSLPNDDTTGVALDDYQRWSANFGQSAGSGGRSSSSEVPEPAIFMLMASVAASFQAYRLVVGAADTRRNLNWVICCRNPPRIVG